MSWRRITVALGFFIILFLCIKKNGVRRRMFGSHKDPERDGRSWCPGYGPSESVSFPPWSPDSLDLSRCRSDMVPDSPSGMRTPYPHSDRRGLSTSSPHSQETHPPRITLRDTSHFHALKKEMATHSSVLVWDWGAWWAAVYGVQRL